MSGIAGSLGFLKTSIGDFGVHTLTSGQIYAAALDVTDPEPLPRDHPLLQCDNLTIAPHLGSATQQTRLKMAELSVANLLAVLAGLPLLHEVSA